MRSRAGESLFCPAKRSARAAPRASFSMPRRTGPTRRGEQSTNGAKAWRNSRAANALLVLGISAALAGPLLGLAGYEGGGLHLLGRSSTGKTTALCLAASVWGRGDTLGFVRAWRATINGLEGAAAGVTDTALILDELGQAEARELAAALYMLANGSGKARAHRDGSLRDPKSWRVLTISSGEVPIDAKLAEDHGRKSRAGQLVRMLNIPADRGRGFGVFDGPGPGGRRSRACQALQARGGVRLRNRRA